VLESEAARPSRPGEKFIGLLARALRGQKISDDHLYAGLEDAVDVVSRQPAFAGAREATRARVEAWGRQARPAPPPRRAAGPDPRIALGFSPGQKLTVEQVKKRHRELARQHHPDRGGSVKSMAAINHAVDQLLADLEKVG